MRRLFYAVRSGWFRGVFRHKQLADCAIQNYPNSKMQIFFSRYFADKYVYGPSDHLVVFTDGSYKHKTKQAGYGVFFSQNDKRNENGKVAVEMKLTSEIAEAFAIMIALEITDSLRLEIRTDALQLLKKITRRKSRNPLITTIQDMSKHRNILWTYIPGHSGYKGNEAADLLARQGCQRMEI